MRSPSNRGEPLGPPREDLSKCGVGLYFELQDQDSHPVIKEVTARGSAEREGSIQAGDKILAVDDESVEGKLLHQIRSMIVGEPGTLVKITILRNEDSPPIVVPLIRGNPMYWYWSDKNQALIAQRDELLAMADDLRKKIRDMEDVRMRQSKEALQELMAARAEADATVRGLEDRLRSEREEHERLQQRAVEDSRKRHMDDVDRMTARIRELEAQTAALKRQHEEQLLDKRAEYDRGMHERAKDLSDQLAGMSAQSTARIQELEAALMAKSNELEKAQVTNWVEHDKAMQSKMQEQSALLEQETKRHHRELAAQAEHFQQSLEEVNSRLSGLLAQAQKQNALQATEAKEQQEAALRRLEGNLEQQRRAHADVVNGLRGQVEEKTTALESLEAERARLAAEAKLAGSKAQQLSAQLAAESAQWQEEKETMRLEVQSAAKSKEANLARVAMMMDETVKRFDGDIKTLHDDIAKLQEALRQSQAACLKAAGEARNMSERARLLQQEKTQLLEAMKKLEDERGALLGTLEQTKAKVLSSEQLLGASAKAQESITTQAAELAQQVETLRAEKRALLARAEAADSTAADLKQQIGAIPSMRDSLATNKVTIRELEGKLGEFSDVDKMKAELAALREEKLSLTQQLAQKTQELKEQLLAVKEERDALKGEMDRFYALPNPCGVGMGLDLTVREVGGKRTEVLSVMELVHGMSAYNCGVIARGDALLEVDGTLTLGQKLDAVKARIAGKRGTRVRLRFGRKADGEEYTVVLKRGAWGPEQAVVAPEHHDMMDAGRWPAPKSGAVLDKDLIVMF